MLSQARYRVARGCLGFVVLLFWAASGAAQDLEPFDPRSDYVHRLGELDGEHYQVSLNSAGFAWPDESLHGDTAFLEVRLRRSRGAQPAVRARSGDQQLVQFFEKGARGLRYLDVSPLLPSSAPRGRVALISAGAQWETEAATLHVFSNPELAGRRVLVVAPHPDDAEIAAFGVYSTADADVVTVTAGDAGGQSFGALFADAGEHFRLKGWIRTWDSITVPFYGGVEPGRARNLGFYDATLERLYRTRPDTVTPSLAVLEEPGYYRSLNVDPRLRERPFEASWEGLVADLLAELERVEPQIVFSTHPLLDRHRDHQFTTIALIEALERWPGDCELYLYTNHASRNESYPLGPRRGMSGLPPWTGEPLFAQRLYSHPLTPHEQALKLVALEAMHDLRPFDLRDDSQPKTSRRERKRAARYDYFRRAPRPNELFFVVSKQDAFRLRDDFLERSTGMPPLNDQSLKPPEKGTS